MSTKKPLASRKLPLNGQLQTLTFDDLVKAKDMLQTMIDLMCRQAAVEFKILTKPTTKPKKSAIKKKAVK